MVCIGQKICQEEVTKMFGVIFMQVFQTAHWTHDHHAFVYVKFDYSINRLVFPP